MERVRTGVRSLANVRVFTDFPWVLRGHTEATLISSASTFRVNGVVFIESLADDELHTGRWVEEELAAEFDAMPLHHEYRPVRFTASLFPHPRGGVISHPSGSVIAITGCITTLAAGSRRP